MLPSELQMRVQFKLHESSWKREEKSLHLFRGNKVIKLWKETQETGF